MNYFKLLLLSLFIISLSSCSKDNENDGDPKTKMLTGKNWVMTGAIADPPIPAGETAISDIFPYIDACTKDDLVKFNSDGTLVFDEGATKCSPSDPQSIAGNWSLNADKIVVTLSSGGQSVVYNLIELSSSTLKLSFPETDEDSGVQYTVTATYSAR